MEEDEKLYGRKRVKKIKQPLGGPAPVAPEKAGDESNGGPAAESARSDTGSVKETETGAASIQEKTESAVESKGFERKSIPAPPARRERKPRDHRDRKINKPFPQRKTGPGKTGIEAKNRINVSIIIPAYNEEENIKPLAEMFDEVINRHGQNWEVVLVNDGSTDKTLDRCREVSGKHRWLRIVSYPRNRGLTGALNAGFDAARGSVLVFYPADLQYHAQDIPKLLAKIDQGADLVAGWKQGKYGKKFISYVYNLLCRALFGLKIHDLNSVKAFKRDVARSLSYRKDWHRYMVVMAAEKGYNIDEVKVKLYPRIYGKSKFGMGRILGGVLDLFSVKFQITFLKKPLRFFGTWGFFTGGAGFVIGLIALYLRLFTTHGSRTLLYPCMLLILAGLMLFAIGFLAEVLIGLKDEIESLKSRRSP